MVALCSSVATAVVLAIAGCSRPPAPPPAPSRGSSVPPPPRVDPAEPAAAIAALIPACQTIHFDALPAAAPAGMTSTATCRIAGLLVHINSYRTASAADPSPVLRGNGREVYYARGRTWTVFTATDEPLLQLQLTHDASGLLRVPPNSPPAVPDLPGEHATAQIVTAAIGGEVAHYRP